MCPNTSTPPDNSNRHNQSQLCKNKSGNHYMRHNMLGTARLVQWQPRLSRL